MIIRFRSNIALFFCGIAFAGSMLVGCGVTDPFNHAHAARAAQVQEKIMIRQKESLLGAGPKTIRGKSSRAYVGNRRWMIFPRSDIAESDGNRIISIGLREFGTATALTDDGYFLTAAHVVETDLPVALNKMDARPARIVRLFPNADLALIKFPFKVGRHFDQLAPSIEAGDYLFSDAAKGTVRKGGVSAWKNGLRSIECNLPSAPGQSGGPVANAKGELVGVIVAVYQMRLTKRITDTAIVTMVEPKMLRKLIADDRRAQEKTP